jgi:hypothetical protein
MLLPETGEQRYSPAKVVDAEPWDFKNTLSTSQESK